MGTMYLSQGIGGTLESFFVTTRDPGEEWDFTIIVDKARYENCTQPRCICKDFVLDEGTSCVCGHDLLVHHVSQ